MDTTTNSKVHWGIGVSKNMLFTEDENSESFIKSLDDNEMAFIADFFAQELHEEIGEERYEELWETSISTALQAVKDIRSGKLKLDEDK